CLCLVQLVEGPDPEYGGGLIRFNSVLEYASRAGIGGGEVKDLRNQRLKLSDLVKKGNACGWTLFEKLHRTLKKIWHR
ncbi:hypothetical protein HAX54_012624, partial [Datura stramonium]|nr:hypothetical protein [Datura stramonium]